MTAHMRLRTRMVLWFTASVAVIMAVFFLAVYAVTGAYLDGRLREDLSLALEQLAAQVEHENDRLIYEDETPIAPGVAYFIMEENGSEMISRGEDIALFDGVPLSPGCFTKTRVAGMPWLLLDSSRLEIAGEGVLIRVAASCEESRRILGVLRGIFAFSVPFMTMLAAVLGLLMENRSLVLRREQLLSKVWGYDYMGETNVVDVYIRYLRSKIDEKFGVKFIHTVRGAGYVLREEP